MRGWPLLLTLLLTTGLMAPAFGAPRDDDEDDEGGTTVVTSRGPEKKGLQVRSKFFRKKGRIEITPNFGYITNNEFNQDMSGGLDVAIHLSERFALEFGGLYAFLGANNQKDLAAAVLSLTDPNMLQSNFLPHMRLNGDALPKRLPRWIWSPKSCFIPSIPCRTVESSGMRFNRMDRLMRHTSRCRMTMQRTVLRTLAIRTGIERFPRSRGLVCIRGSCWAPQPSGNL